MYANLFTTDSTAYLSNTGYIKVDGANQAHQAYVQGNYNTYTDSSAGGTAHITTWAMQWKDYAPVTNNQKPFGVKYNATLNFANTRLILTPSLTDFEYGKAYAVKDIAYDYDALGTNKGFIDGKIGSAVGALPFLTAQLTGTDLNDQKISLSIDPKKSDGQTLAVNTVNNAQAMFSRVNSVLSDNSNKGTNYGLSSGNGAGARFSLQVRPYYGYQKRSGAAASSHEAVGGMLFGNFETSGGHSFGVHVGMEQNINKNDGKTLKSRSTSGLLGVHGRYQITDPAYIRGQVSGVISTNDNDFYSTVGTHTRHSNTTYGLYGGLFGGYDFNINKNNTITPEIGISALRSHLPKMNVTYDLNPTLNQEYAKQDYTAVYANASLRWTGDFDLGGYMLKPTVMAGVRQTLTDGKMKSKLTYMGDSFSSSITDDLTVGFAQVGVSIGLTQNIALSLSYYGEYGDKTSNHMAYAHLKWTF